MRLKKGPVVAITLSGLVIGCASDPSDIEAQYVSPMQYNSYNCNQVEAELQRVSGRVREVTGVQKDEAQEDAIATGVGLVLFWPALFFLGGDDKEQELSRLKGEYNALEKSAIKKECDVAQRLQEVREKNKEAIEDDQENASDEDVNVTAVGRGG